MANPTWDETEEVPAAKIVGPSWDDTEEISVSKLESGVRGGAQGLSLGFADEITATGGGMWDDFLKVIAGESGPKAKFDELGRVSNAAELNANATYGKRRDESREAYRQAEEANPATYGTGEVAGSIASAFIPGVNIAKGGAFAGRVGQAAALGGVSGLGMSDEESLSGLAADTAKGAALGAGFQGAGEGAIKLAGYGAKAFAKSDGMFNKGLSKVASWASGVDEDAAMRQLHRPRQAVEAEADDFAHMIGQRAVADTAARGSHLGQDVGSAGKQFIKESGDLVFESAQQLPSKIDEFLAVNAPSQKGFSALDEGQILELENMSKVLKGGDINGEDLFKFRQYLDHVEKLAGKYDQAGTSPYVRFLKEVRHDADQIVDKFDPRLDNANKAFSQFADDTSTLRSATNESQAESMISNLFGANKKAKQEAAGRLFDSATLESAKDIASNKAFEAAKKPGGDNYFRRGALPQITFGSSELVTSPTHWKIGLRSIGNLQEVVRNTPERFGKYSKVLTDAASRGNPAIAATHFLLQQNDPDYRKHIQQMEEDEQ